MERVVVIEDPPEDAELCGWDGPGWYFWDETDAHCHGPFATKSEAEEALDYYSQTL